MLERSTFFFFFFFLFFFFLTSGQQREPDVDKTVMISALHLWDQLYYDLCSFM